MRIDQRLCKRSAAICQLYKSLQGAVILVIPHLMRNPYPELSGARFCGSWIGVQDDKSVLISSLAKTCYTPEVPSRGHFTRLNWRYSSLEGGLRRVLWRLRSPHNDVPRKQKKNVTSTFRQFECRPSGGVSRTRKLGYRILLDTIPPEFSGSGPLEVTSRE